MERWWKDVGQFFHVGSVFENWWFRSCKVTMLRSRLLSRSVELSCSAPVSCWGLASSSRNETEGEMNLLASVGAPGIRPGFQQEQGVNVNEPTKLGNMLWYVSQSSVLTMFTRSLPVGRLVLRFCKVQKPWKTTNHWWCTHQNWATSPFFASRNHHLHPFFRLSLQSQVENIDTVNRPVVFFDYDPRCNAAPRDYSRHGRCLQTSPDIWKNRFLGRPGWFCHMNGGKLWPTMI